MNETMPKLAEKVAVSDLAYVAGCRTEQMEALANALGLGVWVREVKVVDPDTAERLWAAWTALRAADRLPRCEYCDAEYGRCDCDA